MLDGYTFEPTMAKSGKVQYLPPSTYFAGTGWNVCETGYDGGIPLYWRAFFSFDTSLIPDHAQIEAVSFRFRRRGDPLGDPETYRLKISIGTFIGSALNGTQEEYDAGELMVTLYARPADKDLVDLSTGGQNPCPYVNRTGETDIKVWDDSTQGSGDPSWNTYLNKDLSTLCKLEVVWSIPSASVTGKGFASCIGTVKRGGRSTVAGDSSAVLAGSVTAFANAAATGVSEAYAAGSIEARARGLVSGTGSASLEAYARRRAAALATGSGNALATANISVSAEMSVLGRGDAACIAACLMSAAAAATARTYASLAASALVDPLAVYSGTRSVSATYGAARAVRTGHSATRSCGPDSVVTRGARRVS